VNEALFPSTNADPRNPEGLVFTSRQVMDGQLPLLLVSHDADGDWQFVNGSETDGSVNGILVHAEHVVELYPDVGELSDLPVGWIAWRSDVGKPWYREPRPPELD